MTREPEVQDHKSPKPDPLSLESGNLSIDNQVRGREFAGLLPTGPVQLPELTLHGLNNTRRDGSDNSDLTVSKHQPLPGDSGKYSTAIDQAFAAHLPVDICIWNESDRTAAEAYIRGTNLSGDARIVVTSNPDIQNGDTLSDGRTAIRYAFGGSSSGGGMG